MSNYYIKIILMCICGIIGSAVSRKNVIVNGYTAPGFEAMRETFRKNLTSRHERGASCVVYYKNRLVVDLWGGYQDAREKKPWRKETRTVIFSSTKGIAALAFNLAYRKGFFNYEDKVSKYWPEFGTNGRENITIYQLLSMQSGLILWSPETKRKDLFELMANDSLIETELLKIKPYWPAGEYHGYSPDVAGHFYQALFKKINPTHMSLGQFIKMEICAPLGAEFDLGIPPETPDSIISPVKTIIPPLGLFNMRKVPEGMKKVIGNPRSLFFKSMSNGPRGYKVNNRRCQELELPSGNGIANARALASIYNAFLNQDSLLFTGTENVPNNLCVLGHDPEKGIIDQIMNIPARYHLGLQRPDPYFNFGSPCAFGFVGASGTFAYADPEDSIAYAYVTNKMDFYAIDPRDIALRNTLKTIIEN